MRRITRTSLAGDTTWTGVVDLGLRSFGEREFDLRRGRALALNQDPTYDRLFADWDEAFPELSITG